VNGGGTELTGNNVNLNNTAVTFLAGNANASQAFTFNIGTSAGQTPVTVTVNGSLAGISGTAVISQLNTALASYGISASIANDGTLQFSGSAAFTVTAGAIGGGGTASTVAATNASHAINTSNYSLDSTTGTGGNFVAFANGSGASTSETVNFNTSSGAKTVTLNAANAGSLALAETTLNAALSGTGISAITNAAGNGISFQSASSFTVDETNYTAATGTGTGNLFGAVGNLTIVAPSATASSTGNALAAITAINAAITQLGNVQSTVGAGEMLLQYATDLANSQITNFSAAESRIKDANVAAEAANLSKAQVLEQSSIAAMAQANSAPQALLKLLQ